MLKLENSIRGLSFSRVAFDLTIHGKKLRIGLDILKVIQNHIYFVCCVI